MGANLGNTTGALASYRKALALLDSVVRHDPANRAARPNRPRFTSASPTSTATRRDAKQALAGYREAERLAEALLPPNPPKKKPGGSWLESRSPPPTSCGSPATTPPRSTGIPKRWRSAGAVGEASGGQALQTSLASAYSAVGMCDVRLGRLKEGLERYSQAAARMEHVVRLDPANVSSQRGLMFAYAHIGDVLGNPNLHNLGDTAGAIEAYRRMSAVARRVHEADPADQRAAGDYGIALARVAAAMPGDRIRERLALLRQSLKLHRKWRASIRGNLTNRSEMSMPMRCSATRWRPRETGRARFAPTAKVWRCPRRIERRFGSRGAHSCDDVPQTGRGSGQPRRPGSGLTYAKRALEMSDPGAESAKGRPVDLQRFLTPRGFAPWAWCTPDWPATGEGLRRREDAQQARQWLEKGLTAWRSCGRILRSLRRIAARCVRWRRRWPDSRKVDGGENGMTLREKQLVRESFQGIGEVAGPLSLLFYGRLFELDPALRPMFRPTSAAGPQVDGHADGRGRRTWMTWTASRRCFTRWASATRATVCSPGIMRPWSAR